MKKTYLITGIEPELRKDFKSACAYYGTSMRDSFIEHMEKIASDFNIWRWGKGRNKPKRKKGK